MTSRFNLLLALSLTGLLGLGAVACNKSENKPAPEAEKAESKPKKSKPKVEKPKEPPTILPRVSMEEPRTESGDAPVPEELEAEAAEVIPPENLEAELDNLEAEILGGG